MANSHVLKLTPSDDAANKFKLLPSTYMKWERKQRAKKKY
jgi:hypothetical protein